MKSINTIVGSPHKQIDYTDPNVSDYEKFETAKNDLAYCLYMMKLMKRMYDTNSEYYKYYESHAVFLANYLEKQSNKKSGCYIATMVYGNYDHPNVLVLRRFRDNFLSKTDFGKWCILFYYKNSPALVERLKNKSVINSILKKILDKIVFILD